MWDSDPRIGALGSLAFLRDHWWRWPFWKGSPDNGTTTEVSCVAMSSCLKNERVQMSLRLERKLLKWA